ncbi:MAG: hypothetical protein ACYS4T_05390 [Planctomycetota bacterium]
MPPTVVTGADEQIPWPAYSREIGLRGRLYYRQRCIGPQRNFHKEQSRA